MSRPTVSRWTQRRWWVLGGLIVIAGLVALFTIPGRGSAIPGVVAVSGNASSVQLAHAACENMDSVQKLVKGDASANEVFSYLNTAANQIASAANSDPVWISLQSGIDSVQTGLQKNDANSSSLGIAIVRDQCRRAGVTRAHVPPPSPGEPTT